MQRLILLDTCAALWIVAGVGSQKAADALADARRNGLVTYVSPISVWEVGLLARKGRFRSQYTPQRWFEVLMRTPGTALTELSPQILLESSFLPGEFHSDPANRIIAATARQHGYTVMTRDSDILDYAQAGHVSAIAC
jgi:PIN domain nuclease of toxin-antitoxin system